MNRKIICIGIICMFLATGLMTVSAVKINSGEVKSSEELPDFTVTKLRVLRKIRSTNQIYYKVEIRNIGAPVEEMIETGYNISCDRYKHHCGVFYQGSGPIIVKSFMDCDGDLTKHTLTIEFDPPYEGHPYGDIEELDETNNVKTITFRMLKERTIPTFDFLRYFPLLEQLINFIYKLC